MRKGTLLLSCGTLMIAAAILLTGYNLWDSERAGKAAEQALSRLTPEIKSEPVSQFDPEKEEYPDYQLVPDMGMPSVPVDGLDYVGILSFPTLGLELPVIEDWNDDNLKTSACRYAGTAYQGNLVICAHNYRRHFGGIGNLRYGDKVIFTDLDGNRFSYHVVETETLPPEAIAEMTEADWDLTLFTCNLEGNARITVRCEKTNE